MSSVVFAPAIVGRDGISKVRWRAVLCSWQLPLAGAAPSVHSYYMLSKKLVPVGNSLGLVIDKPILDMLSINKDTELEIRIEGNGGR